jgi:plastocyanin
MHLFIEKALVMVAHRKIFTTFATLALAVLAGVASAQNRLLLTLTDEQRAPVADAVVMLQPAAGINLAARLAARDVLVKQIEREFLPRVTLVGLGSKATFPNNDTVQHSVYSFSKAKPFEIPIYSGNSPTTVTFDRPGVVTLGCNIHDWMVGYIVVADTPVAELTKADGLASIGELPPGNYTLRIWHPLQKIAEYTQTITIAEATQRLAITLALNPPRTRYKPPLNLKRYD